MGNSKGNSKAKAKTPCHKMSEDITRMPQGGGVAQGQDVCGRPCHIIVLWQHKKFTN